MPKPYIGPKVQVHVPEADYDAIIDEMEARGWTEENYPDMLREVFAAGVQALKIQRVDA